MAIIMLIVYSWYKQIVFFIQIQTSLSILISFISKKMYWSIYIMQIYILYICIIYIYKYFIYIYFYVQMKYRKYIDKEKN